MNKRVKIDEIEALRIDIRYQDDTNPSNRLDRQLFTPQLLSSNNFVYDNMMAYNISDQLFFEENALFGGFGYIGMNNTFSNPFFAPIPKSGRDSGVMHLV